MDLRSGPCEATQQHATHRLVNCLTDDDVNLLRWDHECRTPSELRPCWARPPRMLYATQFKNQLENVQIYDDKDLSTTSVVDKTDDDSQLVTLHGDSTDSLE